MCLSQCECVKVLLHSFFMFDRKKRLNGGVEAQRLVALLPRGNMAEWKRFGLIAGKSRVISSLRGSLPIANILEAIGHCASEQSGTPTVLLHP